MFQKYSYTCWANIISIQHPKWSNSSRNEERATQTTSQLAASSDALHEDRNKNYFSCLRLTRLRTKWLWGSQIATLLVFKLYLSGQAVYPSGCEHRNWTPEYLNSGWRSIIACRLHLWRQNRMVISIVMEHLSLVTSLFMYLNRLTTIRKCIGGCKI